MDISVGRLIGYETNSTYSTNFYEPRRIVLIVHSVKNAEQHLRAGDLAQIRGADEILRPVDKNGMLDGLPSMPEMLAH